MPAPTSKARPYRINPRKLLHSKWTAVKPENRERHFIVSEMIFDEDGIVQRCSLEAVHSRRVSNIDWRELKNPEVWLQGWK